MSPLTFFYPVLDALSRGPIIRRATSIGLRIVGILVGLTGLAGVVGILQLVFQQGVPPEATIGGILVAALVAAALYCVVQVCFYRASSVDALPVSDYTVVPIVSVVLRALGEGMATLGVAAGVGGFLALLLSGPFGGVVLDASGLPSWFVSRPSSASSFIAAVSVLAYALVLAFLILLSSYFLAEIALAWVDAARRLEGLAGSRVVPPVSPAQGAPAAGHLSQMMRCAGCDGEMTPGDAFCAHCGASTGLNRPAAHVRA